MAAAGPSRATIRSKGQSLGAELSKNFDALVANPGDLKGFITRNAELGAHAKDAQVAADLSKNNATMADILRLQSKKLTSLAPMTPVAFMKGLCKMFPASGGEGVDWVAFGSEASAYFREPPSAHSMYHMCVGGRAGAPKGPSPPPAPPPPPCPSPPPPPPQPRQERALRHGGKDGQGGLQARGPARQG